MNGMLLSRRSLMLGIAATGLVGPHAFGAAAFSVPERDRIAPLARKKGIPFGSAMDVSDLKRENLLALYKEQCTSITPRNAMKWTATEKRRAKFNFSAADKIVDFARQNDMQVHGHTLVWHNVPKSVSAIQSGKELEAVMRRHIEVQAEHFAGKVGVWDVVNEPLEYDSGKLRQSVFYQQLGEAYIGLALQTAKDADPASKRIINETHLEKKGPIYEAKRASFLALVDRLLDAGAPLDGIGLQGHFRPGLDALDQDQFGKFCSELNRRKLDIYITELDASCRFVDRIKGFSTDDYGAIFATMITTAAQNGSLRGVTVWGLAEQYAESVPRESTAACRKRINLYDENNTPRATVDAIIKAYEALPDA